MFLFNSFFTQLRGGFLHETLSMFIAVLAAACQGQTSSYLQQEDKLRVSRAVSLSAAGGEGGGDSLQTTHGVILF